MCLSGVIRRAVRGGACGTDVVAIIYTSGTSGEAKGVMLNAGNVSHMLECTSGRLTQLMKKRPGQDGVFHYLPFCFAGSWIMLLTCLLRGSQPDVEHRPRQDCG